jgi:hypothetical protein
MKNLALTVTATALSLFLSNKALGQQGVPAQTPLNGTPTQTVHSQPANDLVQIAHSVHDTAFSKLSDSTILSKLHAVVDSFNAEPKQKFNTMFDTMGQTLQGRTQLKVLAYLLEGRNPTRGSANPEQGYIRLQFTDEGPMKGKHNDFTPALVLYLSNHAIYTYTHYSPNDKPISHSNEGGTETVYRAQKNGTVTIESSTMVDEYGKKTTTKTPAQPFNF